MNELSDVKLLKFPSPPKQLLQFKWKRELHLCLLWVLRMKTPRLNNVIKGFCNAWTQKEFFIPVCNYKLCSLSLNAFVHDHAGVCFLTILSESKFIGMCIFAVVVRFNYASFDGWLRHTHFALQKRRSVLENVIGRESLEMTTHKSTLGLPGTLKMQLKCVHPAL